MLANAAQEGSRPATKPMQSRLIVCGVLLGLWLAAVPRLEAEPVPLRDLDQARVNQAIKRGVAYLRQRQQLTGTWAEEKGSHPYGYASLPGMTLLECGTAASHSSVQRALSYLRQSLDKITGTYELSLTIMFLDRYNTMNDRLLVRVEDRAIIQQIIGALAMRLMAAQQKSGGWAYSCPSLDLQQCNRLYRTLQRDKFDIKKLPEWMRKLPVLQDPIDLLGKDPTDPAGATGTKKAQAKKGRPSTEPLPEPPSDSDNSNTQFATLALWVAQRHEVPVARSLKLLAKRFRVSQNQDGGWGYAFKKGGGVAENPAFICSGIIALTALRGVEDHTSRGKAETARNAALQVVALVGMPSITGQGVVAHALKQASDSNPSLKKRLDEPYVQKAFGALARHVGAPVGKFKDVPLTNLYFLWALERLAMILDLQTIAGKDWYRWGVEMIVANQKPEGNWESTGHGTIVDTCFALLFLKQVNIAEDLTEKLREEAQMVAQQPPANPPPPVTTAATATPKEQKPVVAGPAESRSAKPEPASPPAKTDAAVQTPPSPAVPAAGKTEAIEPGESGGSNTLLIVLAVTIGVALLAVAGTLLFVGLRGGGSSRRSSSFARDRSEGDDEDDEDEYERRRPQRKSRPGNRPSSRRRR